jgi:hypothetical protein
MFWNDSCDFDPKSALLAVRIVALARDIATHSVSQVLFDAGEPRPAAQQTTTFMLITGTSTRVPTAIDFVGVPVMVQANMPTAHGSRCGRLSKDTGTVEPTARVRLDV